MHDLSEEVTETCAPVGILTAIIRSILIQTAYLLPAKWPELPKTVRFNRPNFGTNCVSSFCPQLISKWFLLFLYCFFVIFEFFFSACQMQITGQRRSPSLSCKNAAVECKYDICTWGFACKKTQSVFWKWSWMMNLWKVLFVNRLGAIILFCSSIDYLLSDSLVYLKNVKNKSLKFPR